MSWPYILCHSVTSATYDVANIGNVMYNKTNWHEWPVNTRGYPLLIMARSHNMIYFTGWKMIRASNEVLMKLNNTAVSYFVMFRSIKASV